jgi:arylsulfatase A-like enzyme
MQRKLAILLICVLVVAGAVAGAVTLRGPKHKNVVVLMLDTTRADHLGVYGYGRNTSPVIDAFARENVMFKYAVTAAPWTPPSVASMFTGVYPATHGWMPPNDREEAKKTFTRLDEELVTLAEIFKGAGYGTAAASPNPWITEEFGYNQGFDTFWYKPRAAADEIVRAGMKFTDTLIAADKPFLLYLHFLDPHDPYDPPEAFRQKFTDSPLGYSAPGRSYGATEQKKINLYDAEIAYLDSQLGKLIEHFKAKGIYEDLTIIVVADHGEQFMERGNQGHGFQLFNEELHVPLIVKSPRFSEPRAVELTASTIDVFPTALAAAGLLPPVAVPGVSLFDEEALGQRRGVFSEINRKRQQRAFTTTDGMKLIMETADAGDASVVGVFNRKNDYLEQSPLPDKELVATLESDLKEAHQFALGGRIQSDTARGQLKDSTVEQLKTLGYLQ